MRKKRLKLDYTLYREVPLKPITRSNPDLFGVEFEIEGRGITSPPSGILQWYNKVQDHSLRTIREDSECAEYVFKRPLDYEDTSEAISQLFKYLNSEQAEVFDSYRTSTHVHINCATESLRTIYNFITLAIIFDELFVSQNGEHRVGNNFCLRAVDAQAQIVALISSITTNGSPFRINTNNRYSSVNTASLTKFGTIEFRSLEFTPDFDRTMHWINTLQSLKVAARSYNNPLEIIKDFSLKSTEEFIDHVLHEFADKYKNVLNYESMIMSGVKLAQDLAYCCMWENLENSVELSDVDRLLFELSQQAAQEEEEEAHLLFNYEGEDSDDIEEEE